MSPKVLPSQITLAVMMIDWVTAHWLINLPQAYIGHNYAKRSSGDTPMESREKFVPNNLIRYISNPEDESSLD